MMAVSVEFSTPFHTKCLEILCNLTRFPSNNTVLAHNPVLVDTFVNCGKSKSPQDRVWAMRGLQNLASDSSSKLILATKTILTLLSICAVRNHYDEQVAAVATLYNLSTDAGMRSPRVCILQCKLPCFSLFFYRRGCCSPDKHQKRRSNAGPPRPRFNYFPRCASNGL